MKEKVTGVWKKHKKAIIVGGVILIVVGTTYVVMRTKAKPSWVKNLKSHAGDICVTIDRAQINDNFWEFAKDEFPRVIDEMKNDMITSPHRYFQRGALIGLKK